MPCQTDHKKRCFIIRIKKKTNRRATGTKPKNMKFIEKSSGPGGSTHQIENTDVILDVWHAEGGRYNAHCSSTWADVDIREVEIIADEYVRKMFEGKDAWCGGVVMDTVQK